jgi:hypothetical protein
MSLWFESLSICLSDCESQEEETRCILSYLAMPVPRDWWEECLQSNEVRNSYAQLLNELCQDLHKMTNLKWIDYSLLIALAFIDDEIADKQRRFGAFESQYSTDVYLKMAKIVLEKKPELRKLGKMIDKHLKEDDSL